MGVIPKTRDNIFPIPSGACVNSKGYVYLNVSSYTKTNRAGKKTTVHDKIAIGIVATDPSEDWKEKRLMFANNNFHELRAIIEKSEESGLDLRGCSSVAAKYITEVGLEKVKEVLEVNLSEDQVKKKEQVKKAFFIPKIFSQKRDEAICFGLFMIVRQIASKSGLLDILVSVFGYVIAMLILDLALYIIDEQKFIVQFMPDYAHDHAIFSKSAYSDGYISQLLTRNISLSKINLFKFLWANRVLRKVKKDEELDLCYDSTNVNSQCETEKGIELVQKGFAKDKKDQKQVNIDYIIRQKDGIPVTFNTFPGSIPDVSEANEMFAFFEFVSVNDVPDEFKSQVLEAENDGLYEKVESLKKHISFIFDRGYVSKKNLDDLDNKGFGYLLLLKGELNASKNLIDKYFERVKSRRYEIDVGLYGMTTLEPLFDDDEHGRYCHIIYAESLRGKHEAKLRISISDLATEIQNHIKRGTAFTEKGLNKFREFHNITVEPVVDNKNGKNRAHAKFKIVSFEENFDKIDRATAKCGFFVLVSAHKMTAAQALGKYKKRERVETIFMILKSFLGMDCLRAHSANSIQIRTFIWFIATIIYSEMFTYTEPLRKNEQNVKRYTNQAIIVTMRHVKAIFNYISKEYSKGFKLDKNKRKIFECFGINENDVYEFASSLDCTISLDDDN